MIKITTKYLQVYGLKIPLADVHGCEIFEASRDDVSCYAVEVSYSTEYSSSKTKFIVLDKETLVEIKNTLHSIIDAKIDEDLK